MPIRYQQPTGNRRYLGVHLPSRQTKRVDSDFHRLIRLRGGRFREATCQRWRHCCSKRKIASAVHPAVKENAKLRLENCSLIIRKNDIRELYSRFSVHGTSACVKIHASSFRVQTLGNHLVSGLPTAPFSCLAKTNNKSLSRFR